MQEVAERDARDDAIPEQIRRQVEDERGDDHAAADAEEHRHQRQRRLHDAEREEAGEQQEARRRDAHRGERVELVADLHRAELGGDGGAGPAGENDGGHHRAELADHGDADHVGDEHARAEALQEHDALERERGAEQEAEQANDADGVDAHLLDLVGQRADGQPLLARDDVEELTPRVGEERQNRGPRLLVVEDRHADATDEPGVVGVIGDGDASRGRRSSAARWVSPR